MTIQSRGSKRTRQLSSVLPICLFSDSLLALAVEEKRKTRGPGCRKNEGGRRGILVQHRTCWGGMAPWCPHFCPVLPARLSPMKSPTFLYFVSDHKFPCPCKSEFTFAGPLIVAQAEKEASLSSQSTAVSQMPQWSVLTMLWEEEARVWLRC